MDRRPLVVLTGVAVTILLVSVATAGDVQLWHAAPTDPVQLPTNPSATAPPVTFPPPTPASESADLPQWIGLGMMMTVMLLGAVMVIVATAASWRQRIRLRWGSGSAEDDDDFDVLPDLARSMQEDAADQRAVLLTGSPRNAIVECWLRLEAVVFRAGMPRDPADTPTELTERVLASYAIDRTAILDLTALYREARFSSHEMGEPYRARALAALDAVQDGFRAYLDQEAVVSA